MPLLLTVYQLRLAVSDNIASIWQNLLDNDTCSAYLTGHDLEQTLRTFVMIADITTQV